MLHKKVPEAFIPPSLSNAVRRPTFNVYVTGIEVVTL